jgi:outer membrane receptor protein involved in Fe transport
VSWLHGSGLRITLSARNLFNQEYYFDAGSESADTAPPRQVLISTTIRFK